MNQRRRLSYVTLAVLAALVGTGNLVSVCAQGRPAPGAEKRDRRDLVPPDYKEEKLPRELEDVLKRWETATDGIEALEGDHRRYVYDLVFAVEKRAEGSFYYKSPDNGRIDIKSVKVAPGAVSPKKDKKGNSFKLQTDQPERWICDGEQILQINDVEKTVERFPIPPEARGRNIMNGPLPFLFGMPAEQAKKRYGLKLSKQTNSEVWLKVDPRWPQDAANWKEANVILTKPNYLPRAVQLIDPGGNLETVYTFHNLKINPKELPRLFGFDWLKPNLRGFKIVDHGQRMPDLIGSAWKQAKEALEAAGYEVKIYQGKPAPTPADIYRVMDQDPKPNTPLPKGKEVKLILYTKPAAQNAQNR